LSFCLNEEIVYITISSFFGQKFSFMILFLTFLFSLFLINGRLELYKKFLFLFTFDDSVGPWEHGVSFHLVDSEFSFFHLLSFLEHAYTRQIPDQKKEEEWRVESPASSRNSTVNNIETPPWQGLTKVVWMSAISPKAGLNKCSLLGLVISVCLELHVSNSFNQDANNPNGDANIVSDAKLASVLSNGGVPHDVDASSVTNHGEKALHAKHV